MITKPISIPINLLGPGSQPERSVANTIGVPDIVDTFRQPYTPEVANKATAEKCRQFFIDLYEEMRLWNMDSGDAGPAFAMNGYDKDTLALINQMLGEGEVAIRISIPNETFDEIRIQESIFVGVWRVCYYRDGQQIADQLEVSAIPSCVAEAAYVTSQPDLHPVEFGPEAMNSPAIIAELKEALKAWEPGAPAFTINLSHLPMSAEDHKVIEAAVGAGAVQMMSRGFGNCRISSTDVRHVWKVQYLNNAPARLMILNTLVVAGLPEEAVAASEDLADSAVRIKELIEWVTKSWELFPVEVK